MLRDPAPLDWTTDPLGTIADLSALNAAAFEHWFEAALAGDSDLSLEVADRLRRRRFLSTLPLGGRLTALRWLLESPPGTLADRLKLQRQELLTRYPQYEELLARVERLQAELKAAPLAATGADAQRQQIDKLAVNQSGLPEAKKRRLLHEISSVRREVADLAFPPLRSAADVQAALEPRQLMLVFFSAHDANYAWLMSKNRRAAWKLRSSPAELERSVAALLRAIGNSGPSAELAAAQLAEPTWQKPARAAMDALIAGSKVNLSANFDELIIVPDGVLWYLPFEALPAAAASNSEDSRPLLAKCRIRYAPTLGLAMLDRCGATAKGKWGISGVVAGLKPQAAEQAGALSPEFNRLAKHAASMTLIQRPLPAASPLYGSLFDTLAVCDDLSPGENGGGRARTPSATIGPRVHVGS